MNHQRLKYQFFILIFIFSIHSTFAQDIYVQHYTTQNGLAHNIVYTIFQDATGFIWLGTDDGISRFDGTEFRNYTVEDGLAHYAVIDIQSNGQSGDLCLLFSNGVQQAFSNQRFQTNKHCQFSKNKTTKQTTFVNDINHTYTWDTLNNRLLWNSNENNTTVDILRRFQIDARTTNVLLDQENHLWITTEGDGVYVVYTSLFSNFGVNEGLTNLFVNDLMEDQRGRIWAGTKKGFYQFRFNRWISADPESETEVWTFGKGVNSSLFASTNEGIYKINGYPENCLVEEDNVQSFIIDEFGQINLLRNGYFYVYSDCYSEPRKWLAEITNLKAGSCLFEDKEEQLWVGTGQGIFIYKDLIASRLTIDEGLPSNVVYDIQEDNQGNIWVATERGLARISDDQKITVFSKKDGLLTNQCRRISIDPRGGIWIATSRGLHYLKDDFITPFNEETGLSSSDINALFIDKNNQLWIATSNGIARTSIEGLPKFSPPPTIFINSIILNDKLQTGNVFKHLPYDSRLSIDYTAITFQNANEVIYQYRLHEGDEWQTTRNRSVNLTDLREGKYKFELRARKVNSQWSEPVGFEFEINTPYWRSWWFLMLTMGFVIGVALVIIAYIRRQEAQKTVFNKQLAELELNALQSQMNPHFIFNAMNAIQEFIVRNDTTTANRYLTQFATLMRLYLESSKSKYITLDEELKLLRLYVSFEKVCYDEHFDYKIIVDEEIDEEIEIPAMFIQPFVENAIRHGLLNKSSKGLLNIRFYQNYQYIICEIVDNGIGRREAAKIRQVNQSKHRSRGMEIIQQRQSVFNNMNDNSINFTIEDIIDANGNSGTKVLIRFLIE